MPIEFAERTRRIPVYPLAAGYDLGADVAMLASNESCFAPHPAVVQAAADVLGGVNRYPDPSYAPLRRALADRYGIPPQRIALGNGSCDILLAAGEALLEPGAEVVYAWPAFSVYPHLAAASGARAIEVPLDDEDRHDLDAIATEVTVATRLVMVCNPNNPTSTAIGLDEIDAFMRRIPGHVAVILDEAYCEFALTLGDTYASLDLLRKYPNLVLLRTFSKVYGLAALRVGYALCGAEDFRVAVDQVRQPFYLNAAAQAAAVEALATRTRSSGASPRRSGRGWRWRTRCERSGCGWRGPTRTSSGCTCPRRSRRPTSWRASEPWRFGPRRRRPRPGTLAPRHGRHRRGERAVRRRARCGACWISRHSGGKSSTPWQPRSSLVQRRLDARLQPHL